MQQQPPATIAAARSAFAVDTRFALSPLTYDEKVTCEAITSHPGSSVTVMPTHHVNELGNFMGFRYKGPAYAPANTLPVVRTMFHGTTMVQCDNVSEEKILQLMLQANENKVRMRKFLRDVDRDTVPATLDCIPINTESLTMSGPVQAQGLRTIDSDHWTPEVPERIGLYHAYIRGFNRDVRTHKLFIACSGGLSKACDDFCNLIIDVGTEWTAYDVCVSEEAWWLRKACQRARCKLIKQLADAFDLDIVHMEDIQSFRPSYMAIPTTDTLEHDFGRMDDNGTVAVYNSCIDTTKNMNGMLCNMHPSEGVWLFRGAHKTSSFGSMFGDYAHCGVFPVNAPRVKRAGSLCVQDSSCVVRHSSEALREHYMCFDESYFKNLETMQWNRDNGYEALIPIVVGLR